MKIQKNYLFYIKKLVSIVAIIVVFSACGGGNDSNDSGDDNGLNANSSSNDSSSANCSYTGGITEHSLETISQPTTWSGRHLVKYYLRVEATLTVQPCTIIEFASGVNVYVRDGGSIKMKGEAGKNIKLTSANSSPKAGDWNYIYIDSTASAGNVFSHVTFEYGSKGAYLSEAALMVDGGASIELDNVAFKNLKGDGVRFGLDADGPIANLLKFENISFKDVEGYPISLYPHVVPQIGSFTTDGKGKNQIEVLWSEDDATGDLTWTNLGIPYYLPWGLRVDDIDMTIKEGVEMILAHGKWISVLYGDNLIIDGTSTKPILIRSEKPGSYIGAFNFYDVGSLTSLRHVEIRGIGSTSSSAPIGLSGGSIVKFQNVKVTDVHATETCDVNVLTQGSHNAQLIDLGGNSFRLCQ